MAIEGTRYVCLLEVWAMMLMGYVDDYEYKYQEVQAATLPRTVPELSYPEDVPQLSPHTQYPSSSSYTTAPGPFPQPLPSTQYPYSSGYAAAPGAYSESSFSTQYPSSSTFTSAAPEASIEDVTRELSHTTLAQPSRQSGPRYISTRNSMTSSAVFDSRKYSKVLA